MNKITDYKSPAKEIAALVVQGVECWKQAGIKLCELIDEDAAVIDAICAEVPMLTPNILRQLERIGRGQVLPQLVFATGPSQKLLPLPISEQLAALRDGIEVLDDDERSVRRIPVQSLTPSQSSLVFTRDHIRDIAEQRSVLRERSKKLKPSSPGVDFKVFGDHVVTARGMTISRSLLVQWLSQMK